MSSLLICQKWFVSRLTRIIFVHLEDNIGYIKSSYTGFLSSNWTKSKTQTLVHKLIIWYSEESELWTENVVWGESGVHAQSKYDF